VKGKISMPLLGFEPPDVQLVISYFKACAYKHFLIKKIVLFLVQLICDYSLFE
jgi:hypothetical protein